LIILTELTSRLMDGAFVIPGTTIRFGLIWEATQLSALGWLIGRMLAKTFLDTFVGAVPVVGDAFDVLFRANMKNMALLRRCPENKGYGTVGGRTIEGEAVRGA
jgi:hypothetical protein